MAVKRCWPWTHDWTKWTPVDTAFEDGSCATMQMRRCLRCGLLRRRHI